MKFEADDDGNFFTNAPLNYGIHNVRITFPTGTTGTVKLIMASNPNESDTIGPVTTGGEQVSFTPGTYQSAYYAIYAGGYLGVEVSDFSGTDPIEVEVIQI